jgi:hypothetical protein
MIKLFNIQITLEILVYTLSKHLAWYTPTHQRISNSTKNVRERGRGEGRRGRDHHLGDLNMTNKTKQAIILNRLIDYVGTTINKPSPSFDPK